MDQYQVNSTVGKSSIILEDGFDEESQLNAAAVGGGSSSSGSHASAEGASAVPLPLSAALRLRGHAVEIARGSKRSVFGRAQVIVRDDATGVLWAGSDPRADGCAIPVIL